MSDEKKINRDIIYICESDLGDKINNFTQTSNKEIKKTRLKTIIGEAAVIAGVVADTITPLGLVTSAIGSALTYSDREKDFSNYSKSKISIKDDAIQILPINYAEQYLNHDEIKLKGLSNLSIGMILAKHPFLKDTYVEIDSLEKEILHNKLSCLSLIAQYLGAKSISGHAVITEEQKRIHDVSGEVTYEVINGNIQGKTEEYQKYESKYSLDDTFTGEFTPESYEHAKVEAIKFGLNEELDIQNLIEQRNPEHTTSIVSRKLNIELSREYNKAIDAAFSLSVPGIKLGAGYKGILESRKTIYFKMEIKF